MTSSALQLKYVFTPTPNPIRASVGGANPNLIDLQVMVSNPSPFPVALQTISITIPVGQEAQNTLSDSPALPAPVYDTSGGWTISSSGETVTLTPQSGELVSYVIFTLPNIQINETPGVVPLTITELAPPAPKVTDTTTYSLVKQPADFPVTNFYATPPTIYNLDEPVTLYWACSDQGEQFVYSVHSDSWQPDDCLNGGTCYQCSDGASGIETPPVQMTTVFALDVIQTNPGGGRTIYQTLTTTVQMLVPSISGNSYQQKYFSGQIVRLHWLAFNAAYCTVSLDGNVIDNEAPTDTYEQGYWVELAGLSGEHQLSVTAYAQFGSAQYTQTFPLLSITPPAAVSAGSVPAFIAVTPDSSLALITNRDASLNAVTVFDMATLKPEANNIATGVTSWGIAITPDGTLALVVNTNYNNVLVIDIAQRKAEANPIPVGTFPLGIAVTPDGKLALVTVGQNNGVTVIDIASRTAEAAIIPVGQNPSYVAVTPDGTLAFVTNSNDNTVSVIDIASRKAVATIAVGNVPECVAITPDGKLALVANFHANSVTFIDIASRAVEPNVIATGNYPFTIAITPDGAFAFVTNRGGGVTVIDIVNRKALPTGISAGQMPWGVAVTPDGKYALVTDFAGNVVTVI